MAFKEDNGSVEELFPPNIGEKSVIQHIIQDFFLFQKIEREKPPDMASRVKQ